MPLAPEGADPNSGGAAPTDIAQAPPEQPESALDVVSAAARQSNLAATALSAWQIRNAWKAGGAEDPTYDVMDHIQGYESDANAFLHDHNAADVAATKEQLNQRYRDERTIARGGKLGFVSSLALGAVDPVSLAAMAVPVLGEGRLVRALMTAGIGGGTAALQDMAIAGVQGQSPKGEDILSAAAPSAVLGGILGAAIRHRVPARELARAEEHLAPELQGEIKDHVLGPDMGHTPVAGNELPLPEVKVNPEPTELPKYEPPVAAEAPAPIKQEAPATEPAKAEAAPEAPQEAKQPEVPEEIKRLGTDRQLREELGKMKQETGWAEVGGRIIRAGPDYKDPVVGRTSWKPYEDWFQERPATRNEKTGKWEYDHNETQVKNAIDRALAGKKLGALQQKLIVFLVKRADERAQNADHLPHPDEMAAEGFEPKADDAQRSANLTRAMSIDEATVERLAKQHEDNEEGFHNAIRAFLAGHKSAEVHEPVPAGAAEEGGRPASTPEPRPFVLEPESESQLRDRLDREEHARRLDERERAAAELKAKADVEAKDFELTGSNRPADYTARQSELFSADNVQKRAEEMRAKALADTKTIPPRPEPPPAAEIPPLMDSGVDGIPVPPEESTVGAASAGPTMEDLRIGRGAEWLETGGFPGTRKLFGRGSQLSRAASLVGNLMGSPFKSTREIFLKLATLSPNLEGHYKGVVPTPGGSVEANMWVASGDRTGMLRAIDKLYAEYKARMKKPGEVSGDPMSEARSAARQRATAHWNDNDPAPAARMTQRQFEEQIVDGMRIHGDEHAVPEVRKAIGAARAYLDHWFGRAKDLPNLVEGFDQNPEGMPKEPDIFADSYMIRRYDHQAIKANISKVIDLFRSYVKMQSPGLSDAEAQATAIKMHDSIMGSQDAMMDYHAFQGIVPKGSALKSRAIAVPDRELARLGILDRNFRRLMYSYERSMVPWVLMGEKMDGDWQLKGAQKAIEDEAATHITRAQQAGDQAKMRELAAVRDADIKGIGKVRDRLFGIDGAPKDPALFYVRAMRFARAWQVPLSLGAATASHMPDVPNMILKYGLPKTIQAMARLLPGTENFKVAYEDALRLGYAQDMYAGTTLNSLWDIDSFGDFPEQRFMSAANSMFTKLTLERQWITWIQSIAGVAQQDKIIKAARAFETNRTLPDTLLADMSRLGLNEGRLLDIAKLDRTWGFDNGGLRMGGSDKWGDSEATRAFNAAVVVDPHKVTLRPGVADTPGIMSTDIGKLALQFSSFAFSANQTVIMPLAQMVARGNPRAASAVASLLAFGLFGMWLKELAGGEPVPWDKPGKLALELVDHANLMGWWSKWIYPMAGMIGLTDLAHPSDKNVAGIVGGPTGERVQTFLEHNPLRFIASQKAREKGVTRSDLHAYRQFVPGNQISYLRRIVDWLEGRTGDAFDLPGKSIEERRKEREAEEGAVESRP